MSNIRRVRLIGAGVFAFGVLTVIAVFVADIGGYL